MTAPRPGDTYYLDVTYPDGTTSRFSIGADNTMGAYYETAHVLSGCGDVYVPADRRNPYGRLYLAADGHLIAEGDSARFEALS